jgi:ATP-dependent Clp protease ATP-binding subunit ClpC
MDYVHRMTERSRKVLSLSESAARRRGSSAIRLEHVLIGLVEEGNGVAGHLLKWFGATTDKIAAALPEPSGPPLSESSPIERPPEIDQLLDRAYEQARALDHNYIGTEHLILAVVGLNDATINAVLTEFSLTPRRVQAEVYSLLGHKLS